MRQDLPVERPSIVLATINARYIHAALGLRYLLSNMARHGSTELRSRTVIREYTLQKSCRAIVDDLLETLGLAASVKTLIGTPAPVIGLGVYIWNVEASTAVVQLLKELRPDIRIVLGGPEVSYEHEQLPIVGMADYVITGWGDVSFPRLCKSLMREPDAAPRPLQKIIAGEQPPLDSLDLPYDAYNDEDLRQRVIYVEASRGCPFQCEFCLSALDKTAWAFDLDAFLSAMLVLYQRGARTFKFVDRTFNLKVDASIRILEFFLSRLESAPGESLFVHFELVPDHLPDRLKAVISRFPAGVLQFEVGIQSFNPEVQKRISRRQDNEKTESNLRWLAEHSFAHLHADLIFGLPGESWESFASGFDRLYALKPHEIQLGLLKRLRGTPLARRSLPGAVAQWGMVYSDEPPYAVVETEAVSAERVQLFSRVARYWDLVANSGRFVRTLALLMQTGTSPFTSFCNFVIWQSGRHEPTIGLTPELLVDALYAYLTEVVDLEANEARRALVDDYVASGARGKPNCLHGYLPTRPDPKPGKSLRGDHRQQRHQVEIAHYTERAGRP